MSRISQIFHDGHKALITYLTGGYPSEETTIGAVSLMAENGCDIVEIGIPFSDPLADGTTIQKASFSALHNGTTPASCLKMAHQIRKKTEIPLVFMSYYNPIYAFGAVDFVNACAGEGINGLIVPDLPPEEGSFLEEIAARAGIDLIYLLSPTSTERRIKLVADHARGFIYMVSVTGVTGTRRTLPQGLPGFFSSVRKYTQMPLCLGFGISTPEQAGEISHFADGVIIGSRIVEALEGTDWRNEIGGLVKSLRQALDNDKRRL